MKLGKLNLTGIDTELAKGYLPVVGDGRKVFQVTSGTLDSGYDDITSITSWDKYGLFEGYNILKIRNEIITLASDFSSLSEEEKKIASKYFAVSKTNRDSVHTSEEQTQNAINLQLDIIKMQYGLDANNNASYYVNSND